MGEYKKGYTDLQTNLDALIGKLGILKTSYIIEQLSEVSATAVQKGKQKPVYLVPFVMAQSRRLFEVEEGKWGVPTNSGYKDARMACYHLLRIYSNLTYRQIGKPFSQGKRAVIYHHRKCEEMVSIPQFHKPFVQRYKNLEQRIIHFLATLE